MQDLSWTCCYANGLNVEPFKVMDASHPQHGGKPNKNTIGFLFVLVESEETMDG